MNVAHVWERAAITIAEWAGGFGNDYPSVRGGLGRTKSLIARPPYSDQHRQEQPDSLGLPSPLDCDRGKQEREREGPSQGERASDACGDPVGGDGNRDEGEDHEHQDTDGHGKQATPQVDPVRDHHDSLACYSPFLNLFLPRDVDEQRWCYTDRRICTDDRTEEECEGESLQTLGAEEKHRENDDKYRKRREEWASHRIMDRLINHLGEGEFSIRPFSESRSDTIHDDDGIIDRVAQNSEESGEEEGVDLELRKEEWRNHIESESNQNIVDEWDSCHECEWPARNPLDRSSKCILNIEWYHDDGEWEGSIGRFFDIVTKGFPDIHIARLWNFCSLEGRELGTQFLHK